MSTKPGAVPYSELTGRLSVLGIDDGGRLTVRSPLTGLTTAPALSGVTAFVSVWWGSTVFDSASGSPLWLGAVQSTGMPVLMPTAGLVRICLVVAATLRWVAPGTDMVTPLIPIAAGYTLAHYASMLLVEGPRGLLMLVRQWGWAESTELHITPNPTAIAVVQVSCIIVGQVLGVLATHDRALRARPDTPHMLVVADELPSVLLMVGYTWAGLFLLFAA